ncbi:putative copper/iron-regulated glutamine amidotransferase [Aspergillus avenaceus]|uniref:Putative copper/iron-regulated glutamine amidotransferase n=1 Tax=Aspergillus avenaceus TaxID=36643 RepID=A0A5N6TYI7_ASPAV|nr:putative copper/iron-regulated glutamine amidotransferase [Aspergillus avenaceus]
MGSMDTLRIAVLINTPPDNMEFWLDVRESWKSAFATISPTAQVDLYDPVIERQFPDASKYNLIVLSGGKADASSSEPWVLGVLNYVKSTARDLPDTKIIGICWGHQAVNRALGGVVRAVPTGPIAAIEEICLTEAGKTFFPFAVTTGTYKAPEFHVREVATPAPGFIHLAENHECFVNEANSILTFQGHPELSKQLVKKMLLEEDKEYNGNLSPEQLEKEVRKLDQPMDGVKLLERVIQWVGE